MKNEKSVKIILGIDPGLVNTGWAVIKKFGYDDMKYVDSGIIHTESSDDIGRRLSYIYNSVCCLINTFSPTNIAMEEVFVNLNPKSSRKLIMARTASFIAASNHGFEVSEYMPNTIKKAVTGLGHATKEQVYLMVRKILCISDLKNEVQKSNDSTDAIAIAVCEAFHNKN